MHSKWQIWDFFHSFSKNYLQDFNGVLLLNTFDPICLRMVKDHLLAGAGERPILHKIASDVSREWIDEEFNTLSFFGGSDCFYIHQAQDLGSENLETILNLSLDSRFLILCYEQENATLKKLLKENKVETLVVEAPRFWEVNKLLDFIAVHLQVPLSYDAKSWILEALENDLSTFYNVCQLLKLNYPDARELSLAEVKELLAPERLDQFALASLFARRKFVDFFDRLLNLEGDFEKMRGFFLFMQSHLIKMADQDYLKGKARLTQYDKEIQSTSRLWKFSELVREVDRFCSWELLCKKKDTSLWHHLRQAHLKVLNRV
jgi:hypothetical protein